MLLNTGRAAQLLNTTPQSINQHARFSRLPRYKVRNHWHYHVLDLVALYLFMKIHSDKGNGKYIPWHEHITPDMAKQLEIKKLMARIEADTARLKLLTGQTE